MRNYLQSTDDADITINFDERTSTCTVSVTNTDDDYWWSTGDENTLYSVNPFASFGDCGEKTAYALYPDGRMVIFGRGTISDGCPFENQKHSITAVMIKSGVTSIGDSLFANAGNLASVTLSPNIETICKYSCVAVKSLCSSHGVLLRDLLLFFMLVTSCRSDFIILSFRCCVQVGIFGIYELEIDNLNSGHYHFRIEDGNTSVPVDFYLTKSTKLCIQYSENGDSISFTTVIPDCAYVVAQEEGSVMDTYECGDSA